MKDKDKLWLVLYLDVTAIDESEVNEYADHFYKSLQYDGSVQIIVIPERQHREHPVEVLPTPCVLFPGPNNSTKASLKD